ncbi:hypothetical protein D9M68_789500 [compost metagenome]
MNPGLLTFLLAALAGLALCCAGVFVLFGLGWALLSAGVCCFAIAGFVRKGLTSE